MIEKGNHTIVRYGTCTKDCYGSCVFKGIWNDKAREYKFLSAYPLKDHPFTNGFFCQKFNRRQELIYHSDRLKNPLIRTGSKHINSFKPINLKKAIDIISKKLIEIKERRDPTSILGAFYSGNSGLISMYAPLRFFGKLGATVTSGGICNEGGCAGLKKLFGTYSTTNPFQLNNPSTQLIVIWGSNLSENNIHAYFLVKKTVKSGTKLIVVDSRRTLIAEKAHTFLHIFPGTEYLLAKMIINELIVRKEYDENFLHKHVDSFSSIFLEVAKIDKKKLLSQIGINYQTFQDFIELLIQFKHHTLFNIGYGVQKDFYGGRIIITIALIQILLGNIGKPGTGLIYSQSDFLKPLISPLQNYIAQGESEFKIKEIPIIKLGSSLSSGNYEMLFIYNFNPASSLPNQNLLRRALSDKNLFTVVIDLFLNETTKYADIVIPAKFDLETDDFISGYYIPSLSVNIGGPCPYKDCMSNYEFFQRLAWKIGYENLGIFQESEKEIFNNCLNMLPSNVQEDINLRGYYLLFDNNSVPFNNLEFPTPNNQIQATGPHFEFGKKELNRKLTRKKNEFLLISPSHSHFLHSQLGQLNTKFIDEFNKVFLASEDIKTLDLEIGDKVHVSNEYGAKMYTLEESPILKPGTALIYSGISSTSEGFPNVNYFIPDEPEEMGFSGAYNSAIVEINKMH
ncbi:MAG: molybdopterin-dependent oxidoreductase [Promethearchaeota archaeon]|nr:MAG: molybdopterin-dependent oxidoreductase [Candidatus Lokiarchaeota archaeon]